MGDKIQEQLTQAQYRLRRAIEEQQDAWTIQQLEREVNRLQRKMNKNRRWDDDDE